MDDQSYTRPPEENARSFQSQEFPGLDFLKSFTAKGQVRSPKRLWYGSWISAALSLIVFGLSLGVNSHYFDGVDGLGISCGVLGFVAAMGGIAAVFLNKDGQPAYTNLLYYYSVIVSTVSLSLPIVSLVSVLNCRYYCSTETVIALCVFSTIQCGVIIFSTLQIKDKYGLLSWRSFGKANGDVDDARMQNMAAFLRRWNERETSWLNIESPLQINKNLSSGKCLMWSMSLYHELCGFMLIGLGVVSLVQYKPTAVTLTFVPFWNGVIAILCSCLGFTALKRKTNGLGLMFLASNFLIFAAGVAFLVFVSVDVAEFSRCMSDNRYCDHSYVVDDTFMFTLKYSGFAVLLLFQLIFSFAGIVLLFYSTFSCCNHVERNSDLDLLPSDVDQ